jgi:hypothetical protein
MSEIGNEKASKSMRMKIKAYLSEAVVDIEKEKRRVQAEERIEKII